MTYTEDDTFKALRRVPFQQAWDSIGFQEGAEEKRQLEEIISLSDYTVGNVDWQELFKNWNWIDYKNACKDLYDKKYK